jgi:hypothetical protein
MAPIVFVLTISVGSGDGPAPAPVVDRAWVDAQVAEANRIFAPADVSFVVREGASLPAQKSSPETAEDRDAIGVALHDPRWITVAVVGSLRDVDEPGRMRMGVCWRNRKQLAQRYILLSSTAKPSVLAHELGHFFGNAHSAVRNNVMSYERDEGVLPTFQAAQLARVRAAANEYVARGLCRIVRGVATCEDALSRTRAH